MSTLRIVDAPLLSNVDGTEKIPTGGRGDYAVSVDQIKDYVQGGVPQQIEDHINNTSNPHQVTKAQVGLGNVDNTSDVDKPISTATQEALSLKVDKTYFDSRDLLKADKATTYTKTEVDSSLGLKADKTAVHSKSATLPTYYTKEAGVNSVTGVANGAYFNARATDDDDDTMLVEYRNVNGSAVATGKSYPSAQAIVEVQQTVAVIDEKLKRENVSIWDFFTDAELSSYKAAPTTYDASTQVQAFFSAISATDFGKAYCDGNFYVTQGIVFGGLGGSKTKHIIGRLRLTYIGTAHIDTLFTIQPDSGVTWTGGVQVDGAIANAINYANRKVNHGVVIGGAYNCSHFTIDYIYAWNGFKQWGVWLANNTTGANIRKIRSYRSGSAMFSGYIAGETSNFTWVSDKSGSITQRSVITADNIIDFSAIKGPVQARIDGELYWVFTTANAGELETYPLLPSTVRSGTLNYIFGGGFYTSGGDASLNVIGNINASVCANGVLLGALYPPFIESTTTESNIIGLAVGNSLGAACLGGTIGCHYVEANAFNFVENTRADVNFKILNTTVLRDTARLRHMGDYRGADDIMQGDYKFGTSIRISGVDFEHDRSVTSGSANVDLTGIKEFHKNIICNNRFTSTINVSVSNLDSFTKFGTGSARVRFIPTNGLVSPTITINPPNGITINDSSDPIVVSNLVGQPEFEFEILSTTKIGMRIKADRAVSFSHTPTALGAGLMQSTVFTVADVRLGDSVIASFNKPLLGTRIWSEVTAANEVTLYQHNPTSSSVTVASGTVKFSLI